MKACKICGFHNPDENTRCTRCQSVLQPEPGSALPEPTSWAALRESVTARILGLAEQLWKRFPISRFWELPPRPLPYRYPWVAAWLSLLPPAGQLYNRQSRKAAFLGLVFWGGMWLALFTLRAWWNNYLLVGLVVLWSTIVTDAFVTSVRINGERWSFRNTLATWFAMIFYAGVLITCLQFLLPTLFLGLAVLVLGVLTSLGLLRHRAINWKTWLAVAGIALLLLVPVAALRGSGRVFAFVRVTKELDRAEMRFGDTLLVWYGAYWFREPKLGEVVHFDPPRFLMERTGALSSETYIVNIQDYFQRVCGVPGDTIEIAPPLILRNGQLLPRSDYPLGAENLTAPFRFVIPEGHFFLPVTVIPRDTLVGMVAGQPPALFQRGWIFKDWDRACVVPRSAIMGKVLAIANPPERRRWF